MSRVDRIPHDRAADAAAYALGALEDEEAEEYRRHLDRCHQCREQLAAFQGAADALPMAVPQYPAPRGLRKRVLRAVQPEPRVGRARATLVVVTAAVLILALIGSFALFSRRSGGSRVVPARVVSSAGTAALRIGDGHAELIVRHLPAPAAGRIYEVWLQRANQAPAPTTALFGVTAGGAADVGVPGGLDGVREVLVTAEPVGGSRVPTGQPLIVARTR